MKKILSMMVFVAVTMSAQAKVRLPHVIGDNMVLQQQTDARLWGWAKPGKTVTVSTSWSDQKVTAKAGKDGKWLVKVRTPKAGYEPLSITFDDGEAVTINNVVSGEVWVCAGQSNMEMPVKGFGMCPVEGYNHHVLDAAQSKGVRSVKIPSIMRATPQDDAQCEWRQCSPKTVGEFSATGYFFARLLSRTLDIPVGIIEANKGGSRVESWLTKENLEKYTNDPTDSVAICKKWDKWDYHRSLLWGNGTFNPILNFTVKGILYYQGCSNVGDPGDQYSQRMKLLVDSGGASLAWVRSRSISCRLHLGLMTMVTATPSVVPYCVNSSTKPRRLSPTVYWYAPTISYIPMSSPRSIPRRNNRWVSVWLMRL